MYSSVLFFTVKFDVCTLNTSNLFPLILSLNSTNTNTKMFGVNLVRFPLLGLAGISGGEALATTTGFVARPWSLNHLL